MYIAHSALHPPVTDSRPGTGQQPQTEQTAPINNQLLRYQAYQAICSKYRREIADIQKYLPGWQPEFY